LLAPRAALSTVIAGLDPAIHRFAITMDARVEPAHDGAPNRGISALNA